MKIVLSFALLVLSFGANASFITFDANDIEGHGNQATSGGYNIFDSGNGLEVFGNYWLSLSSVSIASLDSGILSFEFMTTNVGEINGFGFDNDSEISTGGLVFNLGGTQSFGNEDFAQSLVANTWYTYLIDFSAYDLSSFDRLLFIADQDNGTTTDSFFRNVELVSSPSAPTAVPAPSTLSVFALFLIAACWRARKI